MNTVKKNSVFKGVPTWGLILITLMLPLIFIEAIPEEYLDIPPLLKGRGLQILLISFVYFIIMAGIAFIICRRNTKNILFVPILCNFWWIIFATDSSFWKNPFWIVICSGVMLSIIASIIGWQKAKKNTGTEASPNR